MAKVVGQSEQEFVFKELEVMDKDIRELVYIYRDVLKTGHMNIPRLAQLQFMQLQMVRALKNIESLLYLYKG
jgi:hypothetical protein